jgi:hypothetical protein
MRTTTYAATALLVSLTGIYFLSREFSRLKLAQPELLHSHLHYDVNVPDIS